MVARDWGEGWLGNVVLHGEEFQSGKTGKLWGWVVVTVAQRVTVLNASEPYTRKG